MSETAYIGSNRNGVPVVTIGDNTKTYNGPLQMRTMRRWLKQVIPKRATIRPKDGLQYTRELLEQAAKACNGTYKTN